MPSKKENTYQDADIIIDKMVKKSGYTQNMFAEKVLGIKGVNVSRAKKTGKIPDNWFKAVEKLYGLSKDELCGSPKPKRLRVESETIFPGDATEEMERDHCIKEMNLLFQLIMRWQEDVNGLDSLTSRNFIQEFHRRFPELEEWQKKQKGQTFQVGPSENVSTGNG